MGRIVISEKIKYKLANKHNVTPQEVHECFANLCGKYLLDTREEHASNPPTRWFIAETNLGRKLKIIFVLENADIYLRSAFPPNQDEIRIYQKFCN